MEPLHLAVSLVLGALLIFVWKWVYMRRIVRLPLPPHPKGYPVVGNFGQMPTKYGWLTYLEWGKELNSDLIYANVFASRFLIINSRDKAVELLDKRSGIYSSRPAVPLFEMMGWDFLLSRLPYGDAWRERRRLFYQHLRPNKATLYQPKIIEYVRRSMVQFERRPTDFRNVIQHTMAGFSISLAYGLDIHPSEDPTVRFIAEALETLNTGGIHSARLANMVPLLKYVPAWFPGAGFKREILKHRKISREFRERPFRDAEAKLATSDGSAPESFASVTLEGLSHSADDHERERSREIIEDTLAMIYAAGTDTTSVTLQFWIRTMLVFPDVQRRVQRELDEVLQGRLPEFSDEASLPWLKASLMESMRMYPTTPLGIAHSLAGDDTFDGYFIPEGTIIIPNIWAMLHNEAQYPDAMQYRPERFIKDGKINPEVSNPNEMAFGFGRRICPGLHIAEDAVFLAAGTILTIFDMCKPLNEKGELIEPEIDVLPGGATHPVPFQSVFKVRNEAALSILRDLESTYYG